MATFLSRRVRIHDPVSPLVNYSELSNGSTNGAGGDAGRLRGPVSPIGSVICPVTHTVVSEKQHRAHDSMTNLPVFLKKTHRV